jgi:hypothetical protein
MDTDCLVMEIKTKKIYDVKSRITEFDTSYYPKGNVYNMPLVNKKILGKFKDELNGKIMEEFIGLRSKLHAHKIFGNKKQVKKAKGINKNVIQNEICFEGFRKCLLTKEPIYKNLKMCRTKNHDIYTVEQNKKALSAYDDKRFILEDGINTLAWRHYKIEIEKKFLNHLQEHKSNQTTIREF